MATVFLNVPNTIGVIHKSIQIELQDYKNHK